jgi:hypothetical protein
MAKRIKVPQKSFDTKDDFQYFVENEREWFYNRVVEAITDAHERGETIASIVKAKIVETMSVVEFTSDIKEWERSLGLALAWFEKQENYEMCSIIFKLNEDVKKYLSEKTLD